MKSKAEESKHEKFVRLAEARTNKIIDTLQLLGNCANTSSSEIYRLLPLCLSGHGQRCSYPPR